jgi:hypothetical protein
MSAPRSLSQPRFEALLYRRSPFTWYLFKELEWWSTEDENLLATITLDGIDNDYAYVVLGRDETGVFRGVANHVSFSTQEEARAAMLEKMEVLSKDGAQEFPQGDNNRKKHEILVPCVPVEKLHPNFKVLSEEEGYTPARGIIKELSFAFTDLDGNYRKDFQTANFDSRLWELYLYAAFYELRFHIDDRHQIPDFIIEGTEGKIAVEAVTVNPTSGVAPPMPKTAKEEQALCRDYMPLKWGSPLLSKLSKKYWEKEHIKDVPLVLAIHDFHGPGSMMWSMPALSDCLYGIRCGENGKDYPVESYSWETKNNIPAGFFRQPGAENVSAVIASNEATLTKFNRMGFIAGFGNPDIFIRREGAMLDLETNQGGQFRYQTKIGEVSERWSHGLWVFHNPKAKHPIPLTFFPNALNVFLDEDGQRNYRSARRYHIVRSFTHIVRSQA